MNYKGVIIEESLSNIDIIKELEIINTHISRTTVREDTPWLEKWTLQTVIIEENKMDEYASRLSTLIDTKHISNWYCDFRNNEYHYVIFSNKTFKLDRSKKQEYLNMRAYGITIGIPEPQLPAYNDLPTNLLIGFLLEAKKHTYASENAKKIVSTRQGSRDYEYSEEIEGEIMTYHDTFFGGLRFIGEEVVYRGTNKPKWAMNYYGVTLDEELSEEALDKTLRPALIMVGEDPSVLPLRGPKEFINGGYKYIFKTDGEMENFTGLEQIYKKDKLVYEFHCHGGLIE